MIFFSLSLLRTNTSQSPPPPPNITVLRFSLKIIFVSFPMVPVFLYFSRVKPLCFLILRSCRSNQVLSLHVKRKFQKFSIWETLMHFFHHRNFTSVFSHKSTYLFCVSLTAFINMHNHRVNCNVCDQRIKF